MGQNQALGVRSGFIAKLRPKGGGTDGYMGIYPCIIKDIGPLGPLLKKAAQKGLEVT